jgi:GNAT superfamily N-acetyltransferase
MDSKADNGGKGTLCGSGSERTRVRDKVVVRRLTNSDSLRELTALIHDAYSELGRMNLHYLATTQDETTTRRRIDGGECWVAEAEGVLVGTILFHPPVRAGGGWYGRADVATFCQFAVAPSAQGAGIGTLLLETVERRATEMGVSELACDTATRAKHLVRMYRRRGYRCVACISWPNTNYYSIILSKSVGVRPRTQPAAARLLERVRFYCSMMTTMGVRRADGKARWWARVLKRLKSSVWE